MKREKDKTRRYFGTVILNKVYCGEKSINLVISKEEGIKLAKGILSSVILGNMFDLAIYYKRKRKDKKISMTITQKNISGGGV